MCKPRDWYRTSNISLLEIKASLEKKRKKITKIERNIMSLTLWPIVQGPPTHDGFFEFDILGT